MVTSVVDLLMRDNAMVVAIVKTNNTIKTICPDWEERFFLIHPL